MKLKYIFLLILLFIPNIVLAKEINIDELIDNNQYKTILDYKDNVISYNNLIDKTLENKDKIINDTNNINNIIKNILILLEYNIDEINLFDINNINETKNVEYNLYTWEDNIITYDNFKININDFILDKFNNIKDIETNKTSTTTTTKYNENNKVKDNKKFNIIHYVLSIILFLLLLLYFIKRQKILRSYKKIDINKYYKK